MKRAIQRDFLERGKNINQAKKDFLKGWAIFNKNKIKLNKYIKKIVIKEKDDPIALIKKTIDFSN